MNENTNISYAGNMTYKGLLLYNKVQRGECSIEITRVVVGTGTIQKGQTALDIVEVQEPNPDTIVHLGEFRNVKEGITLLPVTIISTGNDYYLREVGVYANDPDEGEILYIYTYFGDIGDYVKTYNGLAPTEQAIDIYIAVGNGELIVNPTEPNDMTLREHLRNASNPHKVTAAQVGLGKVENKSPKELFLTDEFYAASNVLTNQLALYMFSQDFTIRRYPIVKIEDTYAYTPGGYMYNKESYEGIYDAITSTSPGRVVYIQNASSSTINKIYVNDERALNIIPPIKSYTKVYGVIARDATLGVDGTDGIMYTIEIPT